MKITNFGRNVQVESNSVFTPGTEAEVLEILREHRGRRIRCIGRLHSWSQVLDCPDVLLDLRNLNRVQPAEGQGMSVEVGAGCQIKHLLEQLERKTPWTLPSVGFITEQSLAGAISTGTHGSGRHSLSHYVIGLRVARYDQQTGEPVIVDITVGDELWAARCSLGCIGVILSVTMQCRPKYLVEEHFREYAHVDEVLASEQKYPLQQFYLVPWRWSYIAQHRRESNAKVSMTVGLYQWYRFLALDIALHLLILLCVRLLRLQAAVKIAFRWIAPACVIRKWSVVGPSSSQLVMEHELFRHIELELFVEGSQLPDALMFLKKSLVASVSPQNEADDEYREQLVKAKTSAKLAKLSGRYCHHYPICIRKVLPDATFISMSSNAGNDIQYETASESRPDLTDGAWYSITMTNYDRGARRHCFEELASFLSESMQRLFEARPHWGKLCPLPANTLRSLYPAFAKFQEVCDRVDPDGVFRNPWTSQLLDNPMVLHERASCNLD